MLIGRSAQLIATVLPENAKTKTVNWSSDNRLVAEVDEVAMFPHMRKELLRSGNNP